MPRFLPLGRRRRRRFFSTWVIKGAFLAWSVRSGCTLGRVEEAPRCPWMVLEVGEGEINKEIKCTFPEVGETALPHQNDAPFPPPWEEEEIFFFSTWVIQGALLACSVRSGCTLGWVEEAPRCPWMVLEVGEGE